MTRVAVGEPPALLKAMDLVKPIEKRIAEQAFYGLIENPGDWGQHRDEQLPKMRWQVGGKWPHLVEPPERHCGRSDKKDIPGRHVASVRATTSGGGVQSNQCSVAMFGPGLLGEKPPRFCGIEALPPNQRCYILQPDRLHNRMCKEVPGGWPRRMPAKKKWKNVKTNAQSYKVFAVYKQSSGGCYGLPQGRCCDFACAVGLLGRPKCVDQLGQHALRYLNNTASEGLIFQPVEEGHQQLPNKKKLFMYADASYELSHEGYRDRARPCASEGLNRHCHQKEQPGEQSAPVTGGVQSAHEDELPAVRAFRPQQDGEDPVEKFDSPPRQQPVRAAEDPLQPQAKQRGEALLSAAQAK
eukprot:s2122_g13.t1